MPPPAAPPQPSAPLRRWSRLPVPARRLLVAGRHLARPGHRPHPRVTYDVVDGVAVLTLDDGKVNAITQRACRALEDALDRVAADQRVQAVVLAGRPGQFCAGFDLETLMVGGKARDRLIREGWELLGRVFTLQPPVVCACTGNAVAAGAALLLTSDIRVGAEGDFRIGFNEAAIGLPLPGVVLTLAGDRLREGVSDEALHAARLYAPQDAVEAGFLHRVVAPAEVVGVAIAEARAASGRPAFHADKQARIGPVAERMREQLPEDLALIGRIGA